MESILNRFPFLERLSWDQISSSFERLNPRERSLALGAIGTLIFFLAFVSIRAGHSRLQSLQTQLENNRSSLVQVKQMSGQLGEKLQQANQLRSRVRPASGFYLSSFVESQASRYRLTIDNLSTESRQDLGDNVEEVSTDVKIASISYPKALNLLTELESSPNVLLRIKRVRIKTIPSDPVNVELSFKVSAYLIKS